jgi:amino acid adenylation domain-containing protein
MIDMQFLLKLRDMGVTLRTQEDRLVCNAPKGALTPEILAVLKEQKETILELLRKAENADLAQDEPIRHDAFEGHPPLSYAQQRLWYLEQLQPGTTAYNMSWALRLTGRLDERALAESLNRIVERHAVLRTTFVLGENEPVQVIAPHLRMDLGTAQVEGRSPEAREAALLALLNSEARTPFDFVKGPLIRARLFRLSETSHVFFLVIHHIVFDGWSFDIFMAELFKLYHVFISGASDPLPDNSIQYADYCFWQRRILPESRLQQQLNYWKNRLEHRSWRLNMPLDRDRPALQTFTGAQAGVDLPEDLVERAREMAHAQNASFYMLLLGVFNILLYRFTGQADLCVGAPLAGRVRKETESLVGFFVQTVVLSCDLAAELSFRELLDRIRECVLEAQAHQDVPFERVVQALAPERDLSMTPIFQVLFNYVTTQLKPSVNEEEATLRAERFSSYQGEIESKFDLTFYVEEFWGKVGLRIVYNADLFHAERIEAMLDQYLFLLQQVIANPREPIGRHSMVTSALRAKLPDLSAPLASEWPGSILERFAVHLQHGAQRTALIDAAGAFSYEEIDRWSDGIARRLLASGVGQGDTVAVYGHRSAGLVLALLGIMKADAAFLILDPGYPVERLVYMVEDAGPRALIELEAAGAAGAALSGRGDMFRLTIPSGKEQMRELLDAVSGAAVAATAAPDQTAYIIFTSGTTGRPKGIVGTHRPLCHFFQWHCHRFGFTPSDRFSMLSGLSHDPLLRDIFTPLWAGATLCIPAPEELSLPQRLRDWMRSHGVTVAHMTPAMGHVLAEGAEEALPELRQIFFGGDMLSQRTLEKIRQVAPVARCVNFYGTTETPQAMGYHVIETESPSTPSQRIPLGRGIDGAQLVVLNASGALAGVGELGEIHVRTPYLSRGYLNDEQQTLEKFVVNPQGVSPMDRLYKTGDLGRYQPDGQAMYYGRQDSQVSIRGFRVELKEIETVLARCPGVRDGAVIVKERGPEDRYLSAFVAMHDAALFDAALLKQQMGRHLPDFMVPMAIVRLNELPLTPNGKIDVRRLDAFKIESTPASLSEMPQTEMEITLAGIWKEVLELETVSVHDNFFDIGGHSLLSIQIIARLEKKIGIRINPREFTYQTLGQMATSLEAQAGLGTAGIAVGKKENFLGSLKKTISRFVRRE